MCACEHVCVCVCVRVRMTCLQSPVEVGRRLAGPGGGWELLALGPALLFLLHLVEPWGPYIWAEAPRERAVLHVLTSGWLSF